MLTADPSELKVIRHFFDELSYAYMCQRIVPRIEVEIFPDFASLQGTFKSLYPIYRLLFSLFWQGHAADDAVLRQAFPPEVFTAMTRTGLLVQDSRKHWRTPSMALIPFEGLYLAVSLPSDYPTGSAKKQAISLGRQAVWLAKGLPASLAGLRVLDVCAGSGMQGLVCAARGATQVVGLEASSEAVAAARFNAALNGFSDRVEIRQSSGYSGLNDDEKFDFIVSSIPFAPNFADTDTSADRIDPFDGSRLLCDFFEGLPLYLDANGSGAILCYALGGQYSIDFNQNLLLGLTKKHGLCAYAYVTDKVAMPDYINSTLEHHLQQIRPDLSEQERQQRMAAWCDNLRQQDGSADFIYEQMIRFWNGRSEIGVRHMPIYNPLITDPLVKRTTVSMLRA